MKRSYQRTSTVQEPPPSPPWRVEDMRRDDQAQGGGRQYYGRLWLVVLGLLILDGILASLLLGAAPRAAVSYTFFLRQVNAGNVEQVTSTGNTIRGAFRHQVGYPPGTKNAQSVEQFTTERPTFADDHLFQRLQASGVMVNAKPPDRGAPLWEQLLIGLGPALLLGGLLVWFWRSGGLGGLLV